jgi:hypothetical protein
MAGTGAMVFKFILIALSKLASPDFASLWNPAVLTPISFAMTPNFEVSITLIVLREMEEWWQGALLSFENNNLRRVLNI